MAWIPITKANLYDAKVGALIDACDTAALGQGQSSRAADLIQSVVDDIRRKVASCRRNRLDQDITMIPKGLRDTAVDLIIARLKTAIEIDLTEDERRNVARRAQDLNRIANGDDVVDQPDNPVPSSETMQGGTSVQFKASPRKATGGKLGGLI